MLIDMHAHTSGISKCCCYSASKVLKSAIQMGIDGIVLTNHYQKNYIVDSDIIGFVDKYINEFHFTHNIGKQMKIKVFFGIEVTMELYPNVHMLIYGVDVSFLKKHPLMFDYTHKELYDAVKNNSGVLIQAHPFRNGTAVLNTDFLDGVEINCHPLYKNTYSQELLTVANENKLAVTCGGDFHADTYRPNCGMYFSENILNDYEIGDFLNNSTRFDLRIQEPDSNIYNDVTYYRND